MKQNNGSGIEKKVFHFHLGNLAVFLTIRAEIALTSLLYGAFYMKHNHLLFESFLLNYVDK